MRHDSLSRCGFLSVGLCSVLALLGCGGAGDESATGPPITAETLEIGRSLYEDWDCSVCHGENGEGSDLGPGLSGLSAHWKLEQLAEYISEPERFIEQDARLESLKTLYPDMAMPAFEAIPPDGRRALAAYLLSQ